MAERDFYEILGVGRDATEAEIKKAFRRLAHEYHPDKHKGDPSVEEKFKTINEAYETLKDPEKRAQYDRFGYVGAAGAGYRDSGFGTDFQDLFGEVFSDFFGGARRRPGPERGADLRYDIEIDFDEAAFGTEKTIEIPRTVACGRCKGSGARPGTQPSRCNACNGTGQVLFQQGFFSISRPCGKCRATGTIITSPCPDCSGSGASRKTSSLTIKIPGGVATGSRLRLTGEGEYGERGGPAGDLYIMITVRPHPTFKRENYDIICEVPISFTQAALGAEIEVPTLEGTARLKVPAGTQSGKVFRMKHRGIASMSTGRRGDEQVIIRVQTPTKLDKRQRELLVELAAASGEETAPMGRNIFTKVKDIFE